MRCIPDLDIVFNRAIIVLKTRIVCFTIIILLSSSLSNSFSTSPEYLGCFLYDDLNTSNGIQMASSTPETCSAECFAKNYTYAEFNNESFCRCTNNYMSKLMKETDDYCSNSLTCTRGIKSNKCRMFIKSLKVHNTVEESYPQAIYLGCYKENKFDDRNRLLKVPYKGFPDNTPQKCSEECFKIGFLYSGTTYGKDSDKGNFCWCGNQYPSNKFKIKDSKCDSICTGDKTKNCGGYWTLSIYATGIVDYPIGNYVGCFHLDKSNQSAKEIQGFESSLDSHRCYYICNERGYRFSEIGDEYCICSDENPNENGEEIEECKPCDDDVTVYCGSENSVSVYENDRFVTGELSKNHFGCFKNNWAYPIMEGWNISYFSAGLMSEMCVSSCYTRRYPYAALVSPNDCLCSFVSPSLEARVDKNYCNAVCSGSSEHVCGDHTHYNVFTTGLRTFRVAGHYYTGCYNSSDNVWAVKRIFTYVNTPHLCSEYCDKLNFRFFGIENRTQCLCGNILPANSLRVDDDRCSELDYSYYCPGDVNKHCGGHSVTAAFKIGTVTDIIYNCSEVCDCYFVQKHNTSIIDCSKKKLIEYSEIYSVFENTPSSINMILKDNNFKRLPNLTSFHNIISLDISNNSITKLDAKFLPKSLKVFYVNNNKLKFIDENIRELLQRLDLLKLSGNPWICDCNSKIDLLEHKSKIEDFNSITCANPKSGFLTHMNDDDLCKNNQLNYFYISIVCCFVLFFFFLSAYFGMHKTSILSIQTNTAAEQLSSETFMQRIQYGELVEATENWNPSRILGKGGFGIVYKGNWRNTDVAIKRFKTEGVAEKFVNMFTQDDDLLNPCKEIMYLNVIRHDNILPMYGFCFDVRESCMIYQFMVNGSLEDRLQRKNGTRSLSWIKRGNIAVGIARGLQFLHNIENPLIHGDIKSANILLDSNFEPRIGDFGLARTGSTEGSFDVSHVCGTKPYLPDDFFVNKKLSSKIDTYSFGVVLFEIATGLRAFYRYQNNKYLKDYVNEIEESWLSDIADKTAGQDSFHVFDKLIGFGKKCVTDKPENRPEMNVVYTNLQNVMPSKTYSPKYKGNQ
ncbi:Hypothetical protein CINCED_3A001078 [Cinara cedri]|uniref:non-specific serine/threonine protein kinase n=1 Tax=Cinara cedri TaxID=506608 RepID=A0A5E4M8Z8_9HEMI|nr:Hypothetical protein CINCED_3A001078 [Cinara cedri]